MIRENNRAFSFGIAQLLDGKKKFQSLNMVDKIITPFISGIAGWGPVFNGTGNGELICNVPIRFTGFHSRIKIFQLSCRIIPPEKGI